MSKTYGESPAMTALDTLRELNNWKVFATSPIGKAFMKFKNAHHSAAQADCTEHTSPARLKRLWAASEAAEIELRSLLESLHAPI